MRRPRLLLALLAAIFVSAVVTTALWVDYRHFLHQPIPSNTAEPYLSIPRGASLREVAGLLVAEGYLSRPYRFLALTYLRGAVAQIKAGEYAWPAGTTPPDLLALLISGRVVQHPITFVEGWTFRRALTALSADDHFSGDLNALSDDQIMARLDRPGQQPEGRFFPDTYSFPLGTPRFAVLRRAMRRMDAVLAEEWERRASDLPLKTPYEALILASIIEKETGLATERPEIAGVFIRRLRRGMRLQTDPTVIYGLAEAYTGSLRKVDLRTDNPYNTYTRRGLPPTPIALPGRGAIAAALNPADGDVLFFVAKGDGSHHFSGTLSEHDRAVERYILGRGDALGSE